MNYMQSQTCKKTIVLHDQDFGQINFTKKNAWIGKTFFNKLAILLNTNKKGDKIPRFPLKIAYKNEELKQFMLLDTKQRKTYHIFYPSNTDFTQPLVAQMHLFSPMM